MPLKIGKPRKRKASKRTVSRQVKDEKARYERCRRRRWGLVKKAREYSALFGAEVYLLVKDEHNAHYFASKDPWISAPQDVGPVRVEAPGRKVHQPQEDQEDQSISESSSDEPLDTHSEGSADATSESPLCATSSSRDLQCRYERFVTRLEKVYRALATLRRPDRPKTGSLDGHVEGLNDLGAYKDWDTALGRAPPSCLIMAGIQIES
ncbi:hypothetical protein LTR70_010260 [Exophiala xenobiotica]|uniref:MADS-box domain-containing protein n=1 Tax=Lithohypha guttulata TaxID=1690604 RepID=A0ABR0JW90_9EURO|nr:hypothetical protein LTR24_009667 [Lithohypha guttulata]KAK5309466.1 hypothetical protein LTR70_010260 [Exophiala xenobiotica]